MITHEEIRFESQNREQVYGWLERVLVEQEYARQGKAARGLVRRYIEKMTGLSRAQMSSSTRSAGMGSVRSAFSLMSKPRSSSARTVIEPRAKLMLFHSRFPRCFLSHDNRVGKGPAVAAAVFFTGCDKAPLTANTRKPSAQPG